jgi:dTDP-4-dehydrorhamnose 3,5-epimerase
MPFQFQRLDIPDVILVTARGFSDARGFFMETFKQSEFAANGIPDTFVQSNFSRSLHGVLRGLHYQKPPHAQAKLVRVLRGEVFDVAVDIRSGSPTFRRWVGVHLSADRPQLLYIPVGFAHGFCVLSNEADFAYQITAEYAPQAEAGIVWNDPDIGISWPVADPILAPRDAQLPRFKDVDISFTYLSMQ